MAQREPDDVNRRFAELIESQFGEAAPRLEGLDDRGRRADGRPTPPLAPPPRDVVDAPEPEPDWYHPGASARRFGVDDDDLDDDLAGWAEDYAEAPPRPSGGVGPVVWAGAVCFALGLLIGLGELFGANFDAAILTGGGVLWVTGLVLLVWAALHRSRDDSDGNGAVV